SFLKEHSGNPTWEHISRSFFVGNNQHVRFERLISKSLERKGYFAPGTYEHTTRMLSGFRYTLGGLLSIGFVMYPLRQAFYYSQANLPSGFAEIDQFIMSITGFIIAAMLLPLWSLYAKYIIQILYHGSGLPFGATNKLREQWRRIYGYRV